MAKKSETMSNEEKLNALKDASRELTKTVGDMHQFCEQLDRISMEYLKDGKTTSHHVTRSIRSIVWQLRDVVSDSRSKVDSVIYGKSVD